MRTWVLTMLATVVLAAIVSDAVAGGYVNGFTTPAGYTYNNGFWYHSGQAYSRYVAYQPGYYSCGYYYPGSSYYVYQVAYPPAAAAAVYPTDPGWRAKLLSIAADRDKAEMSIRKSAVDHAEYMDAINALGLKGNFNIQGYGQYVAYPQGAYPAANGGYFNNTFLGTYGANANTLYSTSYKSVADMYGQTDLNSLYQQSSRLVQNAQSLSGEAQTGFASLVAQAGQNQSRVAEILAKGQALRTMADAIRPEPRATVTTSGGFVGSGVPAPAVNLPAQPAQQLGAPRVTSEAFVKVATERCVGCHAGQTVKGGFDVTKWASFTPEQRAVVWSRLLATSPEKVMPRNPQDETKPGQRLTAEELKVFLVN